MRYAMVAAAIAVLPVIAAGAERRDFSGGWKLKTAESHIEDTGLPARFASLQIEQKEDQVKLAWQGGETAECSTRGAECAYKLEGKPAKATFWFNGPKLVEHEYHGSGNHEVTKYRLSMSDDGNGLVLEVQPIAPPGKTSTLVFEKAK